MALTVFVMVKGRKIILQYTPEAVAERATAQATEFSERATAAAGGFAREFKSAFAERERELMSYLLAETQGDVEDLKARRAASRSGGQHAAGSSVPGRVEDFPDVDPEEQELGYSF
ncbi:hypothetical protein [Timonella sp. A28]|uniref:hypothetical protein n=1 Tax=Timonella sp. A28 TaxID=3442640 RepID=UPI003EB7E496